MQIANEAWEALFRAQSRIARDLSGSAVWAELGPTEYGVLYALAASPGGKRITELTEDVLLTQPGLSRLIARMEARGLVERTVDASDARASLVRSTADGRALQRRVGSAHAREVMRSMTRALDRTELLALRDICAKLDGHE